MFNPLAQIQMVGSELSKGSPVDPNKFGIIESLLIKFAFAFVLVFCVFVYLEKTSSLNGRSPEENKRLFKKDYVESDEKKEEGKNEGKTSSSSSSTQKIGLKPRSRKV